MAALGGRVGSFWSTPTSLALLPQISFKVTSKDKSEPSALSKALAVTWPHLLYYAVFALGTADFCWRAARGHMALWDVSRMHSCCTGVCGRQLQSNDTSFHFIALHCILQCAGLGCAEHAKHAVPTLQQIL